MLIAKVRMLIAKVAREMTKCLCLLATATLLPAAAAWSAAAPRAPRAARRARFLVAQFGQPPPPPPEEDDEDSISPERLKFEAGEGNLFFQSPSPTTSEQAGLEDFLSKENLSKNDVPLQLKVFGGLFAVLFVWLAVQLVIS